MRIYKNDVVKVTVVSAEGKLLAPSVEDSGFTSLAGVISYAKTKNEEMFKYFEARRTKVFYSQIRAMCRFYGKKNVRKYKKI